VSEQEILVVIGTVRGDSPSPRGDSPSPPDLIDLLRAFGPVVGRLRPRLVLLRAPAERAAEIAQVPGVGGAYTEDPPAHVREMFDAVELLFVDAWVSRLADAAPPDGDGLPWDYPGRLPPDPPPRSHPPAGRGRA
jgi:hypothetical protein